MSDKQMTRKAAERLVGFYDVMDYTYWDGNMSPFDPHEDGVSVARQYLRDHPADDSEPITEEWLRSVGGKPKKYQGNEVLSLKITKAVDTQWIETTADSFSIRGSFVLCRWSPLYDDGMPPDRVEIYLPTRGMFRSFSALAGITLKEAT